MAKQLNVDLAFTANTSKAKKQLKELQDILQEIAKMPGRPENLLDDQPIKEASKAALELQQHLAAAMNTKTGNLDLSRLSTSLKNSGKTLDEYYNKLTAVGPEGTKAFLQLAQSIANAENPTARLSNRMSEFLTTLKNTARWQISSSLLHGLTGAVQSAYYYAQDLNESLNNIRIVTGYSTDEMAKFAEKANEAAKALSTTTTEYTDAALIYYQQGLSDTEVVDRTNTTVKMANVTRQSAEEVSQQMTAIWNNFDNGSKSLEYYADVITALGAATASSSDEIAEGLEKFAAVANTVGLSYEYATAALATVTSQTRQSADIVGNAFKTLFARLEGLQLGETLDDGTDLNKYSRALDSVGVSIKDASGDLKDMDDILDELGAKWQTLGKSEQVALAQTVAGVRQYTQLIALMDNYDVFKQNLGIATGSEGALQEQAEIYAESWEAARDRVTAAAEGVFDSLLDDKFFIKMTDAFANVIETIEGVVDGLGGMGGVARTVGALFLSYYAKQMPAALENLKQNFMILTGQANKLQEELQKNFQQRINEIRNNEKLTNVVKVQTEATESLLQMRRELLKVSSQLTEEEKVSYQQKIDNVQAMYQSTEAIAQEIDTLERKIKVEKESIISQQEDSARGAVLRYTNNMKQQDSLYAKKSSGTFTSDDQSALERLKQESIELENELYNIKEKFSNFISEDDLDQFLIYPEKIENFRNMLQKIDSAVKGSDGSVKKLLNDYELLNKQYISLETAGDAVVGQFDAWTENGVPAIETVKETMAGYFEELRANGASGEVLDGLENEWKELQSTEGATFDDLKARTLDWINLPGQEFRQALDNMGLSLDEIRSKVKLFGAEEAFNQLTHDISLSTEEAVKLRQALLNIEGAGKAFPKNQIKMSTAMSQFASASMMAWSAITSLTNSFKTLGDSTATTEEKIGSIISAFMACTMAAKPLTEALGTLQTLIGTVAAEIGVTVGVATAALVAVVAVIGIVIGAYALYTKSLKEAAEEQQKQAEVLTEKRKKLQEESDSINELISKYRELSDELDENGNTNGELKNKIFDLCVEYERYDLAVQSLTMSYKELDEVLRNIQTDQNDELIRVAEKEQEVNKAALKAKIWAESGITQRDNVGEEKTFDIGGANADLQEIIREYVGKDAYLGSGHIKLDSIIEIGDNYSDLILALKEEGSDDALEFMALLEKYKDFFDTINESTDLTIEKKKENIGNQYIGSVIDQSSFDNAVNLMKEKAKELNLFEDDDTGEQAENWARTWLASANSTFKEYAQRNSLLSDINEKIGYDASEALKGYSPEVLAFISRNADSIKRLKLSVEDYAKGAVNYLDLLQAKTGNLSAGTSLASYAEEGKFTEENINNLFAGDLTGFNYSQEEFSTLTSGQQSIALLNYFSQNEQTIKEHKETAIKELEGYKKGLEDKLKEIENLEAPNIEERVSSFKDYFSDLSIFENDFKNIAIKYFNGEELTEGEQKNLEGWRNSLEGLDEAFKVLETDIETYKENTENVNQIRLDISGYEAAIQQIEEATSAVERYKAAHQGLTDIGGDIDDIQSAYSDLNDIVEVYNTNGGFTIDTLQKLMTMEPQYLAALEFEGNQLSINKDYLLTLMKARLEESKALIYEQGYTALLTLAETDNAKASDIAAIKAQYAGQSAEIAGNQALEAAKKWNALVEVMKTSSSDEAKKIIEDTEKRIQAIDKTINNLSIDMFGSGKSGSSSKEKEFKEYLEDVADRYYDINNAISATNTTLEQNERLQKKLNALQKHYSGNTLVQALKAQNKLLQDNSKILEDQYKNYEQLYAIQSQELSELKGQIGGNWNGDVLTNYSTLFQGAVSQYNAVIDAYNAMSAEEQEKSGKQMVEDAKKAYDEYTKALDRYQTLYYNEMAKTEKQLAEYRQKQLENQLAIIENNLKGWETEITLKLDKTEFERSWKQFIHELETDFRKVYKDINLESAFDVENFDSYAEDLVTHLQEAAGIRAEIDKMEASKNENGEVVLSDDMKYGSISEAQEALKKNQDNLLGDGNKLAETYKKVWNNYLNGIDQAKTQLADLDKQYEHISNQLEYEKELIELMYGDEAYDLMNDYYETQQRNIEGQITSTRQQAEFWQKQFEEAYQMNKDQHGVDLQNMATWTEDMKKAYESMIESQEKLNDLVLEGIKNLKDEYLNNVKKTLSEMDKEIWGMDFDELKEDWDFLQRQASEYLDDVEGIYQIQTLANKIDKSIAETTNVKAQQKLAKLREDEIKMLREKENLTKTDVDLAEARYQIALKEIALEEAQNDKNSMKLVRDTSGNWTYQYVADIDNVKDKEQDLLDAYNDLYKTADDAYAHSMELVMTLYEEYKSRIEQIATDANLSEEQQKQKMEQTREQYIAAMKVALGKAKEYQETTIMATAGTFAVACEQDEENYNHLTSEQKRLVDEVKKQHLDNYGDIETAIQGNYGKIQEYSKTAFEQTNINSKTAADNAIEHWAGEENHESFQSKFKDVTDKLGGYIDGLQTNLDALGEAAGRNITDPDGIKEDFDTLDQYVEIVNTAVKELITLLGTDLANARQPVNDLGDAWKNLADQIKAAKTANDEYLNKQAAASTVSSTPSAPAASDTPSKTTTDTTASDTPTKKTTPAKKKSVTLTETKVMTPTAQGYWTEKLTYSDGTTELRRTNRSFSEHEGDEKGTFKTGGYTGSWDDHTGRLAVLHQKELVLNATDTENMLSAVKAVRDISGLNDSISKTIASSIGQLVMNAVAAGGNYVSNTSKSDNTSNVFNITAEFPNADDVQTIKEAILSLPNLASQYILSK